MPGRKLKLAMFTTAPILAAILFAIQHQSGERLQRQMRSLQLQVADLPALVQETELLSNRVAGLSASGPAGDPLKELRKLREETEALRSQAQEMEKLEANNRELSARSVQPSGKAAPEELTRDSWAFSGYATPESALQSVMWAASRGDAKTFAAGMPPEVQRQMDAAWANKSDSEIAAWFAESQRGNNAGLAAYRILGAKAVGDTEALMTVVIRLARGGMKIETMKLIKVENTWRVVGSVKNTGP